MSGPGRQYGRERELITSNRRPPHHRTAVKLELRSGALVLLLLAASCSSGGGSDLIVQSGPNGDFQLPIPELTVRITEDCVLLSGEGHSDVRGIWPRGATREVDAVVLTDGTRIEDGDVLPADGAAGWYQPESIDVHDNQSRPVFGGYSETQMACGRGTGFASRSINVSSES